MPSANDSSLIFKKPEEQMHHLAFFFQAPIDLIVMYVKKMNVNNAMLTSYTSWEILST